MSEKPKDGGWSSQSGVCFICMAAAKSVAAQAPADQIVLNSLIMGAAIVTKGPGGFVAVLESLCAPHRDVFVVTLGEVAEANEISPEESRRSLGMFTWSSCGPDCKHEHGAAVRVIPLDKQVH